MGYRIDAMQPRDLLGAIFGSLIRQWLTAIENDATFLYRQPKFRVPQQPARIRDSVFAGDATTEFELSGSVRGSLDIVLYSVVPTHIPESAVTPSRRWGLGLSDTTGRRYRYQQRDVVGLGVRRPSE